MHFSCITCLKFYFFNDYWRITFVLVLSSENGDDMASAFTKATPYTISIFQKSSEVHEYLG